MTAKCAGGPSAIIPGKQQQLVYAAGLSAIVGLVPGLEWMAALAIVTGVLTYDLQQFCLTDPPAYPADLTPLEVVALAAFQLGSPDYTTGFAKAKALADNIIWQNNCECVQGQIPPPLPPPQVPPPSVQINTPTGTSGCGAGTSEWITPQEFTFAWLVPTQPPGPDLTAIHQSLPSSIQSITITTNVRGTDNGFHAGADWRFMNAQGTFLVGGGGSPLLSPGQSNTQVVTVPATAVKWDAFTSTDGPAPFPYDVQLSYTYDCSPGGAPGAAPCCPPDPGLQQQLNLILNLVTELASRTNEALPNLKDATRHAGLSGMGTITLVDSCAACRVEIKNLPPTWPQVVQVPPYLWSAGFITSVAVGAPLRGWRLIYQQQTFPLASYADQIGYTLSDGLVVDIVEQLPAP